MFEAFGYAFDHRVDRLEEALQILHPLLKGQRATFTGHHYQVDDCLITPLGPRPQGIPLLMGASGPRILRLTARYADQWNTAWLGNPRDLAEPLERLQNACREADRDPAALKVTVGVSLIFPDLGKTNPFTEKPLSGSIEALAHAFKEFEEAGADHLILQATPYGLPTMARVAKAVQLYRDRT